MSNPMGSIYDQVLEQARGEIDDASSQIEELRRTLSLLEARVEASKSVYEAVAARLNLEDDHEEDASPKEADAAPQVVLSASAPPEQAPEPPPVATPPAAPPPPEQAPEPPEEVESATPAAGNGSPAGQGGFSMDLIRRHLEGRARPEEYEEPAKDEERAPEGTSFPELSEAERKLIEEHMMSRQEQKGS